MYESVAVADDGSNASYNALIPRDPRILQFAMQYVF